MWTNVRKCNNFHVCSAAQPSTLVLCPAFKGKQDDPCPWGFSRAAGQPDVSQGPGRQRGKVRKIPGWLEGQLGFMGWILRHRIGQKHLCQDRWGDGLCAWHRPSEWFHWHAVLIDSRVLHLNSVRVLMIATAASFKNVKFYFFPSSVFSCGP